MLKLGNKSISNLFIGQKAATKAFLGQKLVWQKATGLPYDAEVEYLESTGTQYIEVGSIIGATSISIMVSATEIPSSGATKFYGIGYNANFQDDFGVTAAGWGGSSSYPCTIGESILFEANGDGIFINGTQYSASKYFINSVPVGKKVFLFCGSSGTNAYITSSGNYMAWRGRIYSCKIMSGTSVMFDFIPVRKGGVGYLYDRVSRQLFGNQGTGDFIVGPDVVEVEYLESSGTQYIDTGVIVNRSTTHTHRMVLDMAMVSTTGWRLNGCATNGKNAFYIGFSNSQFLYYGNGGDIQTSISSFYDRATFDLDTVGQRFLVTKGDTVVLDTSTAGGANYSDIGLHVWLFGYSGENVKCSCKIYSCKLYQSGVLVRDFVPVRVGTEGVMMDRLTRKIYRNQGTGAFKIGADKKETPLMCNSYVKDGLVAMWDGVENTGWGVHDAAATKPFDLISRSSENIASTFVANKDNIEVTTANTANRATHFSSACANALTSGNLYVECLVYSNMPATAVYGNFLGLLGGSFGYNHYSGNGGISIFSSGWVSAKDVSLVDAPIARLAVSIDSNLGTIKYSVGSQEANGTVTIPQPLSDVQWVSTVGTKIFSMRAYSRALTAEEIAWNYEIDKRRFNLT